MLRLVALACGARADEVLDDGPHAGEVIIPTQPMESALYAFMTVVVHDSEELLQQGRVRADADAAAVGEEAVTYGPWRRPRACRDLIAECHECR